MKTKYEGMKATRKGLIIYFRIDQGAAIRFAQVKIPLEEIDAGAIGEALDQRVRLDLLAIWSQERGDDTPLF